MRRFVTISIIVGMLFCVLDGIINANPVAVSLYAVFTPVARQSINVVAGLLIDMAYRFILAGCSSCSHGAFPAQPV